LLYHPNAHVALTPASAGLAFDPVAFAVTDEGEPRLRGWWIPAAPDARLRRLSVLYLHDQAGNLDDTTQALERLHAIGVNALAFDYRGYGQSQFVRPSEFHWRQDTEWALDYLTETRHLALNTIVLDGKGLGANLALAAAAAHPALAGVIVESPIPSPTDVIFHDPRAGLVPARFLVRDRYDLDRAAAGVRIPVLWFVQTMQGQESRAYARIVGPKMMVSFDPGANANQMMAGAESRWFDDLSHH